MGCSSLRPCDRQTKFVLQAVAQHKKVCVSFYIVPTKKERNEFCYQKQESLMK